MKVLQGHEWEEMTLDEAAMYFSFVKLDGLYSGAYVGATNEDSRYIDDFMDEVMG